PPAAGKTVHDQYVDKIRSDRVSRLWPGERFRPAIAGLLASSRSLAAVFSGDVAARLAWDGWSSSGVLINRPVVSAFGQTGHRADMASGPSLTRTGHFEAFTQLAYGNH